MAGRNAETKLQNGGDDADIHRDCCSRLRVGFRHAMGSRRFEQIVDLITGPVARAAAVIAIVIIAGVTIIFS